MASGGGPIEETAAAVRRFVAEARRGVLATIAETGEPRLVPICFVLEDTSAPPATGSDPARDRFVLYSALDEKPKRTADPLALARVRDLQLRPDATLLVDRWSEDWRQLGWVRLRCHGEIVSPDGSDAPVTASVLDERARAVAALREKYPQYRDQRLESRPLIRLTCSVAAVWGAIDDPADEMQARPEEANP